MARKTAKAFFHNETHGLCRRAPYGDQLVILESLRERILSLEHHATESAHPGMNRMYYAMRRRYYWPAMVTDIYNTIKTCTTCAQNRLSLRRHTSPLTLFPATEPLTDLSGANCRLIPATMAGNHFFLVSTDRFSKLTRSVFLRRITAVFVASATIDAWAACYGPPDRILLDNVVLREPADGGGAADAAPEVWRTRRGVGGADEVGLGRNGDGGPAYERRCEPAKGRASPRRPPRGPSGRGRRARQATTDRAPRGGCSALRAERSLPLVCNDRFRGLCKHGGNYLHWLVTARVKSLSGNWARATVSSVLRRRATTVGGTVVAGK